MNDLQKDNLQDSDPGSTPDDSASSDPLARMQARLSCYIARRLDGLDDPLLHSQKHPDELAHKVGQLASHIDQYLSLLRDLSSDFPPNIIEAMDGYRQFGSFDAYFKSRDTEDTEDTETTPYQPIFTSHYPTTPDSEGDS